MTFEMMVESSSTKYLSLPVLDELHFFIDGLPSFVGLIFGLNEISAPFFLKTNIFSFAGRKKNFGTAGVGLSFPVTKKFSVVTDFYRTFGEDSIKSTNATVASVGIKTTF